MKEESQQAKQILVNREIHLYKWTRLKIPPISDEPLPSPRERHASCVSDNFMYIIGGDYGTTCLRDLWRYDIHNNKWKKLKCRGDVPSHLVGHSVLSHNKIMYIFGGAFNQDVTETPLWIFNPELAFIRKWCVDSGTDHPSARRDHSAVVHDGVMLVYGGFLDVGRSTAELWEFDTEMEKWTLVSPKESSRGEPACRHGHSSVVYDREMWVLGGMSALVPMSDMWKWSIPRGEWTQVKSRQCPALTSHSAVVVADCMFVFGGKSPDHVLQNTLYRYHFLSNVWERMYTNSGIIAPRSSHSMVSVIHPSLLLASPPTKEVNRSYSYPVLNKTGDVRRESQSREPPMFAPACVMFYNRVYPETTGKGDACTSDKYISDKEQSGAVSAEKTLNPTLNNHTTQTPDSVELRTVVHSDRMTDDTPDNSVEEIQLLTDGSVSNYDSRLAVTNSTHKSSPRCFVSESDELIASCDKSIDVSIEGIDEAGGRTAGVRGTKKHSDERETMFMPSSSSPTAARYKSDVRSFDRASSNKMTSSNRSLKDFQACRVAAECSLLVIGGRDECPPSSDALPMWKCNIPYKIR